MKKTVILLLASAWCAMAGATDYKYLVVSSLNGTQLNLPSTNVKITFANGMMTCTSPEGSLQLDQAMLSEMYFSNTEASSIATTGITAGVSFNDGMIVVNAKPGAKVTVANVAGMARSLTVGSGGSLKAVPVAAHGINIVNVNGKTFKILAR